MYFAGKKEKIKKAFATKALRGITGGKSGKMHTGPQVASGPHPVATSTGYGLDYPDAPIWEPEYYSKCLMRKQKRI